LESFIREHEMDDQLMNNLENSDSGGGNINNNKEGKGNMESGSSQASDWQGGLHRMKQSRLKQQAGEEGHASGGGGSMTEEEWNRLQELELIHDDPEQVFQKLFDERADVLLKSKYCCLIFSCHYYCHV
jgi:hypothetical protein